MKITFLIVLLILSLNCYSQSENGNTSGQSGDKITSPGDSTKTLTVWHRDIYTFQYPAQKGSVENRVKLIETEIHKLSISQMQGTVFYQKENSIFGQDLNIIMLGDKSSPESAQELFKLYETDLEPGKNLDKESAVIVNNLNELFYAKVEQEKISVILTGLMYTLFATIILIVAFRLFNWLKDRTLRFFSIKRFNFLPKLSGLNSRELCHGMVQFLIKIPFWMINLLFIYLWITYILSQFPYTKPWADSLGHFIVSKLLEILNSIISAIPGILMAAIIFYIVYVTTRIVNGIFLNIENEKLETRLFDSDTARITRRLIIFLLWLLAVIFTYPYLPGSSSDAFKGVSVFLGLLISLGSTGVVNQIMSGLVIVYSKSMTKGDIISVAEIEGMVKEVGFLSTKVITAKKQEVTIPNSVITTHKVINFSRVDEGNGVTMATTLTIGYDTPWRQVHAMLKLAAENTPKVRNDPPAEIVQNALSDFYISYELRVKLERAEDRFDTLSNLHANILDIFNEHEVQIMSPNFNSQPTEKVFVEKKNWFTSPTESNNQ